MKEEDSTVTLFSLRLCIVIVLSMGNEPDGNNGKALCFLFNEKLYVFCCMLAKFLADI